MIPMSRNSEILLNTSDKTSRILVGESFRNLGKYLPDKPLVIITDENVARHYKDSFPPCLTIVVKPGESSKTMDSAARIYEQLIPKDLF